MRQMVYAGFAALLSSGQMSSAQQPIDIYAFFQKARDLGRDGLARKTKTVDVREATPHLHAPMLLLHDEGDREVPFEDARTFVQAWPGAKLVVTSGLGHRAILRDPDVVTAAAAFIAGKDDVATGLPFGSIERDLFDRAARWKALYS